MLAITIDVEILFAAGWWVITVLVFFGGLALKHEAGSRELVGSRAIRTFGMGVMVATVPLAALATYCTIWAIYHASW